MLEEAYAFLKAVWGHQIHRKANYCLCAMRNGSIRNSWFTLPLNKNRLAMFFKKYPPSKYDIYLSLVPYNAKRRLAKHVLGSRLLFADLDEASPRKISPKPHIAWKTSTGRYAAAWRTDRWLTKDEAEARNKALTYSVGADRSGWDMPQLLRLPGTINHKYDPAPKVGLLWENGGVYELSEFPEEAAIVETRQGDAGKLLDELMHQIPRETLITLTDKKIPNKGYRSDVLYRLEHELKDAGLTVDQTYVLLKNSVWNKFGERDQLLKEIKEVWETEPDTKPELAGHPINGYSSLTRMFDVSPQEATWLWFPYIPDYKLTLLEGDPGMGKSYVTMAIAAALSNGERLPGNPKIIRCKTLLMSAEDGLADTVRVRLDKLGANTKFVYAYKEPITFNEEGLAEIEEAIEESKPRLLIIDPLVAYLGSGVDMFRANEVRPVMADLARIAEDHKISILCVRHLTKGKRDQAIYQGQGSMDFAAAARSILLFGRHPMITHKRVIAQIKNNLGPMGMALTYDLLPNKKRPFEWGERCELTADEILNARGGGSSKDKNLTGIERAVNFLKECIDDQGRIPLRNIRRDAEAASISINALYRAKDQLGLGRSECRKFWIVPKGVEE